MESASTSGPVRPGPDRQTTARRPYDSPVRRQQAAQTRERIVTAAAELVRDLASWDWGGVTVAAVAARAGVHERTVFRHFASEAALRQEVARRLERDVGAPVVRRELGELRDGVQALFEYLGTVPAVRTPGRADPAVAAVDARRREAVLAAVADAAPDLTEQEHRRAAAVLDVLGGPAAFRRLAVSWGMDTAEAAATGAWAVDVVVAAVLAAQQAARTP